MDGWGGCHSHTNGPRGTMENTTGGWTLTEGWVGNKRQLVYIDAWVKARLASRQGAAALSWLVIVGYAWAPASGLSAGLARLPLPLAPQSSTR